MSEILFLDFETRSACDIRAAGADVYARHPSTEILCVGYGIYDPKYPNDHFYRDVVKARKFLDDQCVLDYLKGDGPIVAHNAAFELAIWNHVGVPSQGWSPLAPERVVCTMAMAYAMGLPGALEDAAPAVGLSVQKDAAGHRVMLQLAKPKEVKADGTIVWDEDNAKFQKLYDYCERDIEVEVELFKRLMQLSPQERKVWTLDQKINQRGIRVDLKAVQVAMELVEIEKKRLDQQMRNVTKGAVATCTAVGQLGDWLRSEGVKLKGVAKAEVLSLLDDELPDHCRQALLLRQEAAKSSTAKLKAMAQKTCGDGRIRGTMQYHGAATGRWAGRGLQVQNFPRPKLDQEAIEGVFELVSATGPDERGGYELGGRS